MDYNDMVSIVNEQNWKITYLIMGLSIGVVAFSIQDISKDVQYEKIWILYMTWGLLCLSFMIGIFRLHHLISVTTRNAMEFFRKEHKKEEYQLDENRIKKTNKDSAKLYWIMMFCFLIGIFSFGAFKMINLWN